MVKPFSHNHPLCPYEVEEDDGITCSGCELELSGSAYKCKRSSCDFHLHKSCFELPRKIQHNFHPQHNLILIPTPPYESGIFVCNACDASGSSFTYNCAACEVDLHVHCSSLPETVTRHDHEHPLALVFSLPAEKEDGNYFTCSVCTTLFKEEYWAYRCKDCDYVTHLDCATHVEANEISKEEEEGEEEDGDEEYQEAEDDDDEEEGNEKGDNDGNDDDEEDYDSIIAQNIKRNAALSMIMINNQRFRTMKMQRATVMRNTHRLYQFNL
ncbi:hypothetical protein FNV43_RR09995 [Rhamnella rubrinervis]|uniref:DC1 domain-containing protein n=1 Tax=Rhamnella rubrinervis TaxID=2594499 RepID=A0A8K0HAZ7_9ROSA|nr:hypothetical protein FNV43_RR09995 [Rhamnella rubrinervis]